MGAKAELVAVVQRWGLFVVAHPGELWVRKGKEQGWGSGSFPSLAQILVPYNLGVLWLTPILLHPMTMRL